MNLNEDKNNILGVLDELNSFIGLSKCFTNNYKHLQILTLIQNDIFLIQAEIASPKNVLYKPRKISLDNIRYLEIQTDLYEQEVKTIDHFIIPEGSKFACALHCIRTISRRVEREMLKYLKTESGRDFSSIIDLYARYFDRVACLSFALARLENNQRGYLEKKPNYYIMDQPKKRTAQKRGERDE